MVAAVLIAGTAAASPALLSVFTEDENAARQVGALALPLDVEPSSEAMTALETLQRIGGEHGVDPGDLQLDDARVLIAEDTRTPFELVMTPAGSNQVCYVLVRNSSGVTDCEPPFTRDRPGSMLTSTTKDEIFFFGVVADGVTEVTIATGEDREINAEVARNVYWAKAPASAAGARVEVTFMFDDQGSTTLTFPS